MSSTSPLRAATLPLAGGAGIPQMGLGTWPMNDDEARAAVADALRIGYRHVDTAENYRNELGVGQGIRDAGVAREELFVTTKFNKEWHSIDGTRAACEASLKRLGMDYVDLLLIHWPNPAQDRYVQAFEGLLKLRDAGLVRAVGVSNFKAAHLQKLFDAGLTPQVNQIELSPTRPRRDLVALHKRHGIVTESWSPLDRGGDLLKAQAIVGAAEAHGVTPAQVVLRWHVQQGLVAIPKSSDPKRQRLNLDVFGFVLSAAEMAAIDRLEDAAANLLDADRFGH
ncbi:aldo/keto reductase [Diaphorobacter sp. HDW4A]|uniref:aldo/keto reductase n=1 Tax=Diaphorobacter sp. HDW4A TaxID=2714924 RepID=UPI00140B47B4|nr:aldo/keto reductase [Diaphorobacter sp. HDW4A]QIL83263.1 aldo/keto reductase [Diaphorobacter sp. HDW4A]